MSGTEMKGFLLALLWGNCVFAQVCPEIEAQPKSAEVLYKADAAGARKVIYQPGPDGVLRAVDAGSGGQLWAFTPMELDVVHRAGGLMSDVRVLRFDGDLNGSIEPAAGDRVWLYFGMRRGGRYYYALDVTDGTHPVLLWKLGPAQLPGVGETWSAPTIARVRISGATQNGEHFVLILAGGYDETFSSAHRIFMVDAATGRLLWYAGGPGGSENPVARDLALAPMTAPIPARVAAIDTDGDRFTDRLYAADIAGRIWRFDIWNGRDRSQLVTGGLFAALAGAAAEDARRFFNAPDVALIQHRGAMPYYNIAIGSGNRAQLFDTLVRDRFYSIRDRNPFVKVSQPGYDTVVPITDDDVFNITDSLGSARVPPAAAGWKLELRLHDGWSGEKVVAEALTVNGVILFPTYKPVTAPACTGENRVYALNVDQGNPALDFNDDRKLDRDDASTALAQAGVAGEIELTLPGSETNATPPAEGAAAAVCKSGAEVLRLCVTVEGSVRTFWQRNAAD